MAEYIVKDGDSVAKLAEQHGLTEAKIWDHERNRALKDLREDPNLLVAGDTLFIPDREQRWHSAAAGQRHSFRRKGIMAVFKLQLYDGDQPRANQDYTLKIDGRLYTGTTDGDGKLEQKIHPGASEATLRFGGEGGETIVLALGRLDPANTVRGMKSRLKNLGYDVGTVNGTADAALRAALIEFQASQRLTQSGTIDDQTVAKIREIHDT